MVDSVYDDDMQTILVVEDDADASELMTTALRKAGHKVLAAPNGRDALSQLMADGVDLVITDLRMPQMDGVTLLTLMRSYLRFQSLPVIVFSAYTEGGNAERMENLRVSEVFRKGAADLADVVRAVGRHLPPPSPTSAN